MKKYSKKMLKRIEVDPGVFIRVYRVYNQKEEFFTVTLEYKGWSIPLATGYTPWGAVALASLSPFVRDSESLRRALTVLSQVI